MSGVGRPGRNSRQKKAREGGLDGDRQGPWLKPGRSSICENVQSGTSLTVRYNFCVQIQQFSISNYFLNHLDAFVALPPSDQQL